MIGPKASHTSHASHTSARSGSISTKNNRKLSPTSNVNGHIGIKSYDFYHKNSKRDASKSEFKLYKKYVLAKIRASKDYKKNFKQKSDADVSSTEESKTMKRKKLSIELPDDIKDNENSHERTNSANPVYSNLSSGPHRSVSVQNRTTTITQFTTLNAEEDQTMNFAPSKIEEVIPLKSGREIIVPNFEGKQCRHTTPNLTFYSN